MKPYSNEKVADGKSRFGSVVSVSRRNQSKIKTRRAGKKQVRREAEKQTDHYICPYCGKDLVSGAK